VESFFKVNTPHPSGLQELLHFYEQKWLSKGYASPEEEKNYKDFGKEILSRFWEIHRADFHIPIALEKVFYLDIEGVKLMGFIDQVDKLNSGGLAVVDYKTNKELFTADYLAGDLQLTIYQMAAEQLWRLPVERLTLYHLRSNTACNCPPRGREQLDKTRRLVLEVAENIVQGKFPATENEFCPCDFPEHCPYYRHQFLTSKLQEAGQAPLPETIAAGAVEKYAEINVKIKELQTQLEEARQIIIEYCQSHGLNRVFGSEYEATYRMMERAGFSEDEVRAVLEPAGLWEKVIGLDQSRLKQFLANEAAPEIIKKIDSLKRITSTYPQLWLKKSGGEEE
jgi:putative RecB family exonuclease